MKTLITKLSQKFQAMLMAIQNKVSRLRQTISAWLARKRQAIRRAIRVMIVVAVISTILFYLWQRSPALRSVVINAIVGVVGLWGWLKGVVLKTGASVQPVEIRVPTLQPEHNSDEKLSTW